MDWCHLQESICGTQRHDVANAACCVMFILDTPTLLWQASCAALIILQDALAAHDRTALVSATCRPLTCRQRCSL